MTVIGLNRVHHAVFFQCLFVVGQLSLFNVFIQRDDDSILNCLIRTARIAGPFVAYDIGQLAGRDHNVKFFILLTDHGVRKFNLHAVLLRNLLKRLYTVVSVIKVCRYIVSLPPRDLTVTAFTVLTAACAATHKRNAERHCCDAKCLFHTKTSFNINFIFYPFTAPIITPVTKYF